MNWGRVAALFELLKPITWFAPMWAFACGVVSAGVGLDERWPLLLIGLVIAGPMVCGTSQAVNDWFDRAVDAINEPGRPIPSGRVPGRWGLYLAIGWTLLSLLLAAALGPWGFGAAVLGLLLAWAYSAPPFRLKANGWWGNGAVALCYEGLPWFTGAAVILGTAPDWRIVTVALLYSVGAHGIMTVNDFKAVEGDRRMGIRSLPVQLGPPRAALLTCAIMLLAQLGVFGLLLAWGLWPYAAGIGALVVLQLLPMRRFMASPRELAPWFNGTGISLFVLGMLVSAFALRAGVVPAT